MDPQLSPDCHTCHLPMIRKYGISALRLWVCVACRREIPDETRA